MPLLLILLLGSGLFAQQQDEIPTFRSGVTLVKVDIEVAGRDGRAIPDLTQQDFRIFDENQPQEIAYFGRESEPLDLLLLLDVSDSMRKSLQELASGARAALAQLRPGDRVAVMLFSRDSKLAQPLTTDVTAAQRVLLESQRTNLGIGTVINDSLIAAATYLKEQPAKGRRAVVVLTDNESLNYKSPDDDVVRAMYAADAVLNAIVARKGARPGADKPGVYRNPDFTPSDVYSIAERTGGAAVEGLGKVSESFQRMIERIRSRYFVQYPAPQADPGKFRRIRVELTPEARRKYPEAVIRARAGYYTN